MISGCRTQNKKREHSDVGKELIDGNTKKFSYLIEGQFLSFFQTEMFSHVL